MELTRQYTVITKYRSESKIHNEKVGENEMTFKRENGPKLEMPEFFRPEKEISHYQDVRIPFWGPNHVEIAFMQQVFAQFRFG